MHEETVELSEGVLEADTPGFNPWSINYFLVSLGK